MANQSIQFGSGILADGISPADSGKINAQGIFTDMWAWGFPCTRNWSSIVTLLKVKKGNYKIKTKVVKVGKKDKTPTTTTDISCHEDDKNMVFATNFSITFGSPGRFTILFSEDSLKKKLTIPFEIKLKDWPQFSEDEVKYLISNEKSVGRVRADVICNTCKTKYTFEDLIVPNKSPDKGVHDFPESGFIKCKKCSKKIFTKDLQGQVRQAIKSMILNKIGEK